MKVEPLDDAHMEIKFQVFCNMSGGKKEIGLSGTQPHRCKIFCIKILFMQYEYIFMLLNRA